VANSQNGVQSEERAKERESGNKKSEKARSQK
jgi:hypothetical protein